MSEVSPADEEAEMVKHVRMMQYVFHTYTPEEFDEMGYALPGKGAKLLIDYIDKLELELGLYKLQDESA